MQESIINNLLYALQKANCSLMILIDKLEADGYLKNNNEGNEKISKYICNELAGFLFAVVYARKLDKANDLTGYIPTLLGNYFDRELFIGFSRDYSYDDYYEKTSISGYDIINRFDMMASEFDGAFYKRMQVDSPGRITDLYIDLLSGYAVLCDLVFEDNVISNDIDEHIDRLRNIQSEENISG